MWMVYRTRIVVSLIVFVLALSLRLWGIDNGLPHVQRPDETVDITQSFEILQGQTLRYAYHRVIWSLIQIPVHGTHFVLEKASDSSFSVADFEAKYFTNRASFVLSIRIYVAVIGALASVLVGWCAYLLSQRWQALLLAGGLLAVAPLHNYMSHIGLPDVFATFSVALCALGAIAIMRGHRWVYIVAGVGASLAILARLQSLPLVIGLVALAHVIAWWQYHRWQWRFLFLQWLWAAGAFFVTHLIFNPYIIFDLQAVIRDFEFIYTERYTGTNPIIFNSDATYNPFANFTNNLHLPLILLRWYMAIPFVVAFVIAISKKRLDVLVVALMTILFSFSLLPSFAPRLTYWLPAIVPFTIVVGWGLDDLIQRQIKSIRLVGIVGSLFVLGFAGLESGKISYTLAQPDTQSLAYIYVEENILPDSAIVTGDTFVYSVPLSRNIDSMVRAEGNGVTVSSYQFLLENPQYLPSAVYDIYGYEFADDIRSDDAMRAFLDDNQIAYVIEADYCGGEVIYDFHNGLNFPILKPDIRDDLTLIYSVSPFGTDDCLQYIENRTHMEFMQLWDWVRVGPIVRIYAVGDDL